MVASCAGDSLFYFRTLVSFHSLLRPSGAGTLLPALQHPSPPVCAAPPPLTLQLSQAWLDRDEGVDGSTILHGSVESLMEVGFSRTVAQRITTRVRQLGGPSTQVRAWKESLTHAPA
jgi:hypothetical protein